MGIEAIGCCGAYCGTCPVFREKACKGCKLGYRGGGRDLSKARCKIKVCCIGKGYISCADCGQYGSCDIIRGFHAKKGYKYKKYKEAIEFIRSTDYEKFIQIADRWKIQYGKYE
jgi:hypothetical protein